MPRLFPRFPKEFYRAAVSIFLFVLGLEFATWASRIPDIRASLQLDDAQLGTMLFAVPLGQFPAMFASGFLVSRFGSRKMLAAGVGLYSFSLLALGLACSPHALFCALIVFGAASNLFDNAVNTQAVGVEMLYRRSIMARFHALWSIGGVFGGGIGALMAMFHVSPLAHFALVSAASVILLGLFRKWILPHDVRTLPAGTDQSGRTRFPRPDVLLVLLGILAFASMATEGVMYDWSSVYYVMVLGEQGSAARTGYITCMCCMVCGRLAADTLIMRVGDVRVLQGSGALMACGLGLMTAVPDVLAATVGSGMTGLGMAAGVPICFSLAGKTKRIPPSIAISIVTAISFCGFMLCPPVIGHLAHIFGLRWALAPIAVLGLTVMCIAPFVRQRM